MNEYKTVEFSADDSFVEKRSRFIGYARPVKTNEEAVAFINEIKSNHWDATHNVYAYVLRDGQIRRYSDDGEPQGTAGIPVLDVLIKEGLTDVAVVVTRYFGGVLLGTGGLVRAYSHSAKIAVTAANIITMSLCCEVIVRTDYNFYGRLNSLIPECGGAVENTQFTDSVEVSFIIPKENVEAFSKKLTDAGNGKYRCEIISERYSKL
ncbi:MAG: YigZ family protein [Oscillospiraceae bacterium]|nr:YigZ family protein [Oscillospiraceae bacterium]